MVAFFDSGIERGKIGSVDELQFVYIELKNYDEVLDFCKRAKEIKNSEKCAYRLAHAYKKKGEARRGLMSYQNGRKRTLCLTNRCKSSRCNSKPISRDAIKRPRRCTGICSDDCICLNCLNYKLNIII